MSLYIILEYIDLFELYYGDCFFFRILIITILYVI